jgi:hypothetical protein
LHAAGDLILTDGSLYNRGTNGLYWSCSQSYDIKGFGLHFDNSNCGEFSYNKPYGFTARCLKDTTSIEWTCGYSITVSHVAGEVAPVTKTVTYGTANNIPGETSKCWITQNLGADHQATAVNDANEQSAGWYWQFNRQQGHKHDGITLIPSWTITVIDEDSDWLIANDPCALLLGSGWRLPTSTELTNVDASGGWMNWNGPWNSALKMHAAGYLSGSNGSLNIRGSYGYYWSSTQTSSFNGSFLVFNSSNCDLDNDDKAGGFSARCLRD